LEGYRLLLALVQGYKRWNKTEVVFQLSEEIARPDDIVARGVTKIDFTHIGLVPEVECYDVCEKGWNGHINTLDQLINEGKGLPE